jgi:hypothetical protein
MADNNICTARTAYLHILKKTCVAYMRAVPQNGNLTTMFFFILLLLKEEDIKLRKGESFLYLFLLLIEYKREQKFNISLRSDNANTSIHNTWPKHDLYLMIHLSLFYLYLQVLG